MNIVHNSVSINNTFEKFTNALESALGRLDHYVLDQINDNPAQSEAALKTMEGAERMMIFTIEDHGVLLKLLSQQKKAKQYRIGNPLIAMQMTQHDLRAGLYVPLLVLIYEKEDGKVYADYDLPSTLLGQFNNKAINIIAESLDQKLQHLIANADN